MPFSRRKFLQGAALAGGAAALAGTAKAAEHLASHSMAHGGNLTVGRVNVDDFDPYAYVKDFYWGVERETLPNGGRLREYDIFATDMNLEVAPGVLFAAW